VQEKPRDGSRLLHPIVYAVPEGVTIAVDQKQTRITVTGSDRQKVGQVAAEIATSSRRSPIRARGSATQASTSRRRLGKTGA